MGGSAQLWVPPSSFTTATVPVQDQMFYGTLKAGYPNGAQVVTGTNIAGPDNLVASSPPTLLEEFEIYALSIAWGFFGLNVAGTVTGELQLLVNGRRAAAFSSEVAQPAGGGGVSSRWAADLVNPLRLQARDRLGLKVGIQPSAQPTTTATLMVAAIPNVVTGLLPENWTLQESTISYHVLDVPASVRL